MGAKAVAAVTGQARGNQARLSRLWSVLILAVGAIVLVHDIGYGVDLWTGFGRLGIAGINTVDRDPDGFWSAASVRAGGPGAEAGVRPGEALRPDRPSDMLRHLRPGETIGFTLRRDGSTAHREIRAAQYRSTAEERAQMRSILVAAMAPILACLVGTLVVLRSRSQAPALIFGAALVSLGLIPNPTMIESDAAAYAAFAIFWSIVICANPVLFFAYSLVARGEARGPVPRPWRLVLAAFAAVQAVIMVWFAWSRLAPGLPWHGLGDLPFERRQLQAQILGEVVGYGLAAIVLGLAWRESRGRERARYRAMLLAIILLVISMYVTVGVIDLTGSAWTLSNPLVLFIPIGTAAGAGMFAYAVLRHRVIDLGFAVNRTLLYGTLSAILLAAFGLIEWAVEHFLPIEGRENNAIIDAAVALGVFLAFHRVRDAVEEVIERLFFHRWHQAEAALRRFVRDAAFAVRAETLARGFAEALTAYAETEAAIYLPGDDGTCHRAAGAVTGLADALDPDDPALMALRAEPKPLLPEQPGSVLLGTLVVPMVNRNEVIGLAVLGARPDGSDFRPDEIELVGWAARQIGLDLHALKVRQLESSQADLHATVAMLRTEIATLRSIDRLSAAERR